MHPKFNTTSIPLSTPLLHSYIEVRTQQVTNIRISKFRNLKHTPHSVSLHQNHGHDELISLLSYSQLCQYSPNFPLIFDLKVGTEY